MARRESECKDSRNSINLVAQFVGNPTRDILDQLKVFLKKADLPDIRFHDLRHSAATLLLSLEVHPKVVQEILGHSQISMTLDVYSHVMPSMHQDAMKKLNEAIEERTREESNPEKDEPEDGQKRPRTQKYELS